MGGVGGSSCFLGQEEQQQCENVTPLSVLSLSPEVTLISVLSFVSTNPRFPIGNH